MSKPNTLDPYVYPETNVLINKFNLKNPIALEKLEGFIFASKNAQPLPEGNLDYAHLKAIHAHFFGDIYPWAGEERMINISKDGYLFGSAQYIGNELNKVFHQLKQENYLKGLPQEKFCEKLSYYFNEINAAHPFREGNGRTQRAFCNLVAKNAGYKLDWKNIDRDSYLQASIAGHDINYVPMADVFKQISSPLVKSQHSNLTKEYIDLLSKQHATQDKSEAKLLNQALDKKALNLMQDKKIFAEIKKANPKLGQIIQKRAAQALRKENFLDL